MIWFILGGIAVLGYIVYGIIMFATDKFYDWGDLFFGAFLSFCISGLVAFSSLFVVSAICTGCAEMDYKLTETIEITALNDNSAVSGHFYLGSGHIGEDVKYYFIEETEKGKHTNSVDADYSYIIESNNEKPRIEVYSPEFKNNRVLRWFAVEMADKEYRIYIPENSITTEFSVDLQ